MRQFFGGSGLMDKIERQKKEEKVNQVKIELELALAGVNRYKIQKHESIFDNINNDEGGFIVNESDYSNRINYSKIREDAISEFPLLISILLKNEKLRKIFFKTVVIDDSNNANEKALIFNKESFLRFLNLEDYLNDDLTTYRNKIFISNSRGKGVLDDDRMMLNYPYKDCLYDNERQKFYNEFIHSNEISNIKSPKIFDDVNFVGDGGFDKGFDNISHENLLIQGSELLSLYSIQEKYNKKVKLVFLNPPRMNDNSFDGLRFFKTSSWLSYMKDRLGAVRGLMKKDGIIAIYTNDAEYPYLKLLMDEIYGKDSFINTITVQSSMPCGFKTSSKDKTVITTKNILLLYKARSDVTIKINPQHIARNEWTSAYIYFLDKEKGIVSDFKQKVCELGFYDESVPASKYSFSNKEFKQFCIDNKDVIFQVSNEIPDDIKLESLKKENENCIIEYRDGRNKMQYGCNGKLLIPLANSLNNVYTKQGSDLTLTTLLCDIWNDIEFTNLRSEGGVKTKEAKLPEMLLRRLIDMTTELDDLVLDIFAKYGTGIAAAHKMVRRWLGLVSDKDNFELIKSRLSGVVNGTDKSGATKACNWQDGGSYISCELKELNQFFISEIEKCNSVKKLSASCEKILKEARLRHDINFAELRETLKVLLENLSGKKLNFEDGKSLVLSLLDKNSLYVSLEDFEEFEYDMSDMDVEFNRKFYNL